MVTILWVLSFYVTCAGNYAILQSRINTVLIATTNWAAHLVSTLMSHWQQDILWWFSQPILFKKETTTQKGITNSVPSEAVCCQIGLALRKSGSTHFVKICKKKMLFLVNWINFQHGSYHIGTRTHPILLKFGKLAPSSQTLEGEHWVQTIQSHCTIVCNFFFSKFLREFLNSAVLHACC